MSTPAPNEAIVWNRPAEVHVGLADATTPNFEREEALPTARRGTDAPRGQSGLTRPGNMWSAFLAPGARRTARDKDRDYVIKNWGIGQDS